MTNDLDALLTALYVHIEDRVFPALGWTRAHLPGRKPALSDAELVCLAAAQHLLGIASERRWVRYARKHLVGMFPQLAGHAGYGYCASHSRFFWGLRLYHHRGVRRAPDPPDRKDEKPVRDARYRQQIEAIIDTLKGQLTLEDHGARTMAGVYARVTARLLAMTAAIWHNWKTGTPIKRFLIAYDH